MKSVLHATSVDLQFPWGMLSELQEHPASPSEPKMSATPETPSLVYFIEWPYGLQLLKACAYRYLLRMTIKENQTLCQILHVMLGIYDKPRESSERRMEPIPRYCKHCLWTTLWRVPVWIQMDSVDIEYETKKCSKYVSFIAC